MQAPGNTRMWGAAASWDTAMIEENSLPGLRVFQAAAPPPAAQLRRQRWRIATMMLWIKWSSRKDSGCTLAQSAAWLHATTCPAPAWEPPVDRDGCGTT